MTDHGTFDGLMPLTSLVVIRSLVCSADSHADCAVDACECPCHVETAAA